MSRGAADSDLKVFVRKSRLLESKVYGREGSHFSFNGPTVKYFKLIIVNWADRTTSTISSGVIFTLAVSCRLNKECMPFSRNGERAQCIVNNCISGQNEPMQGGFHGPFWSSVSIFLGGRQ